jgi:hypothetical protein
VLEYIKSKNGEKNWPARKNRKREGNGDFIKETVHSQAPRSPSKKRQNQPILDLNPFSREKEFLFSCTTNSTEPPLP